MEPRIARSSCLTMILSKIEPFPDRLLNQEKQKGLRRIPSSPGPNYASAAMTFATSGVPSPEASSQPVVAENPGSVPNSLLLLGPLPSP